VTRHKKLHPLSSLWVGQELASLRGQKIIAHQGAELIDWPPAESNAALGLDQAGNFAVAKMGVLEGEGGDPLLDVGCNLGRGSAPMRDLGAGSLGSLNSMDTFEPDMEKSGNPAPGVEGGQPDYSEVDVLCIHGRAIANDSIFQGGFKHFEGDHKSLGAALKCFEIGCFSIFGTNFGPPTRGTF
jgi:hypothetical protein